MSEIEPSVPATDNEIIPKSFSIQEVLSLGYIVLIIIGMYLEFMKYNVFGINIIEHSDFADFLIAPFKNPILICAPIIFGIFLLAFDYFKKKRALQKKKKLDEQNQGSENLETVEEPKNFQYQGMIFLMILLFISMNIGAGIGMYFSKYEKTESKLNANITNAKIDFIDGSKKEVYLLGKNTSNLFYFENQKIELIVCPIPGNVKTINYIPKDQQKKVD